MNPSHSVSVLGLDAGSSRDAALTLIMLQFKKKILSEGSGSLIHHPMLGQSQLGRGLQGCTTSYGRRSLNVQDLPECRSFNIIYCRPSEGWHGWPVPKLLVGR